MLPSTLTIRGCSEYRDIKAVRDETDPNRIARLDPGEIKTIVEALTQRGSSYWLKVPPALLDDLDKAGPAAPKTLQAEKYDEFRDVKHVLDVNRNIVSTELGRSAYILHTRTPQGSLFCLDVPCELITELVEDASPTP